MLFQDPEFQKLLLLHSRDRRYQKLIEELEELPKDLARMDKKIEIERESVELAMAEWKDLETLNNTLEKEILSHNDSINRQRNKQLEVKKNEEYQALENEIANLQSKIDGLENQQKGYINASTKRSMSEWVWSVIKVIRSRASPTATVGGRIATTMNPCW